MEQKKFEYICRDEKKILVKSYCKTAEKVVIENDVTEIGPYALAGMSMKELILPCSLKKIYDFAISDCANLKKITISEGTEENVPLFGCDIDSTVFTDSMNLNEIEISKSCNTKETSMWSFDFMFSLLYQIVGKENPYKTPETDTLEESFAKKNRNLTLCITAKDTSLLIPKHVYNSFRVKFLETVRTYFEGISFTLDIDDETTSLNTNGANKTQKEMLTKSFFDDFFITTKEYRIATALEMYVFTGDETAKEYIQYNAKDVCNYIISTQTDTAFAQFLNLNLLSMETLKDVFGILDKNKMPLSTAYLLQTIQKTKIKDKHNLKL